MKFITTLLSVVFLTGCYTSNQMVISGNRNLGSGRGNSSSPSTPFAYSAKPTNIGVKTYPQNQNNNKVSNTNSNTNINNQTTNINFTNGVPTVTTNVTTTNTSSNVSGLYPPVSDVTIQESVITGRYYIIQ
jgi:hypothetical protein